MTEVLFVHRGELINDTLRLQVNEGLDESVALNTRETTAVLSDTHCTHP
jgi:hypothetical protein